MSGACSGLRQCLEAAAARCSLALLLAWLLLGVAYAQQPAPPTSASETATTLGGLTSEERVDLIARLDDQQVRELYSIT